MESLKSGLGNLAQKARKKTLNTARNYLIFVAILQFLGTALIYFVMANDPQFAAAQTQINIALAVTAGAGVAFLILAFLTAQFPIGATVTALILFITLHAIDAIQDPSALLRGWILKILVIVALVKAIQAATAYEKERKAEANSAA